MFTKPLLLTTGLYRLDAVNIHLTIPYEIKELITKLILRKCPYSSEVVLFWRQLAKVVTFT